MEKLCVWEQKEKLQRSWLLGENAVTGKKICEGSEKAYC